MSARRSRQAVGEPPRDEVDLSVVVPVFRCQECLAALHDRLHRTLGGLTSSFELVFVDDRSPDGSWDVLNRLAAADPAVRLVRLSRNFGQAAATTAGLATSRGRWTVVMDCDLQDPPEEIPRLYAKAQEGYDFVLTKRRTRRQSLFRRLAGRAYFRLRNFFMRVQMDPEHASLSILSRKVVDAFLSVRDRDRHYMLILHWLGFEKTTLEIEQAERLAGTSSYSLRKLVRVGIDGFFFQTTILLRWIVYLGFLIALAGTLLAALFVVSYFVFDPYPGWTSLAVLLLLIGGFIIMSTGVTGLYIGKIFGQVKERPLYIVDVEVTGGVERAPELEQVVREAAVGDPSQPTR